MSRARYRFRDHTLGPDTQPEAEPVTFTMQCTACGVTGRTYTTAERGTGWAVAHLKANPGHLTYREHITRPYRFEPGPWQ